MSYPRIIKNYNAFKDGESYFGTCSLVKLPQLTEKTAAHMGAGFSGEIGIPLGLFESMQVEMTFDELIPRVASSIGASDNVVLRPAQAGPEDDDVDTIIVTLRGPNTGLQFDDLKVGDTTKNKIVKEVHFIQIEMNGALVLKVEPAKGIYVSGGTDRMAGMRRAMGI